MQQNLSQQKQGAIAIAPLPTYLPPSDKFRIPLGSAGGLITPTLRISLRSQDRFMKTLIFPYVFFLKHRFSKRQSVLQEPFAAFIEV